jgi:vacuolar iron transporter family protein
MRSSLKTGLGFGITSGVITPLGLLVGLYSGTGSRLAMISGLLTIAIADSFADSLGIHVSQKLEKKNANKHVWEATLSTLFAKIGMAFSFIIPILFFPLKFAVLVDIAWGLGAISLFSYFVAKERGVKPAHVVFEHISIALLVVAITHYFPVLLGKFLV